MYLGSVRFFKHVILGAIILMITIPTAVAINFGLQLQANQAEQGRSEAVSEEKEFLSLPVYGSELEYQNLFPDMMVDPAEVQTEDKKVIYLTFDDGPSERTLELLDLLDQEKIKATFFVTGKTDLVSKEILKAIAERGHAIGIHSYSHRYDEIYQSTASFLQDFHAQYQLIYEVTGVKPEIFRFPGGSINAYNAGNYQEIIAEMTRRGFVYFDWNASSGDAELNATTQKIIRESLSKIGQNERIILLAHDSTGKETTVKALPAIIRGYKEAGYRFQPLSKAVKPIFFSYGKPGMGNDE